jgi:hypothetical protein
MKTTAFIYLCFLIQLISFDGLRCDGGKDPNDSTATKVIPESLLRSVADTAKKTYHHLPPCAM